MLLLLLVGGLLQGKVTAEQADHSLLQVAAYLESADKGSESPDGGGLDGQPALVFNHLTDRAAATRPSRRALHDRTSPRLSGPPTRAPPLL